MLNKNVCPNCGQLYDTDLENCPLCGTAPQVVETNDPVQRKRINDAERKQRRAARREEEREARRARREARFQEDAEEERRLEEEDARRKEEKRRMKEEKKAARRAAVEQAGEAAPVRAPEVEETEGPSPEEFWAERAKASAASDEPVIAPAPIRTPAPAVGGAKPQPPVQRDRRRVPRAFLALSTLVLTAALAVGGSYLLWKLNAVNIPIYDKLATEHGRPLPTSPVADPTDSSSDASEVGTSGQEAAQTTARAVLPGEPIPCSALTLESDTLRLEEANAQTQLVVTLEPSNTTDDRSFTSSNEQVVKVSPVGIVTAVGPGTAEITVTCGAQSAKCTVVCDFEADPNSENASVNVDSLTLIKDDMTFFAAGENYVLSVTNVPVGTPVEWKSLDESICTVDAGGHVVAVGPGTTQVIATVGNLKVGCWVRCKFK